MKRTILGIAFAVMVLGGAVALALMSNRPATAAAVPSASAGAPQTVAEAVPTGRIRAVGAFGSASQATLAFQTGGRVKEIKVKEGALVKAGDPLVTLDTSTLDIQVIQAQGALAVAQAKLDQLRNPAPGDVAVAQATVAYAEAALAQLKLPTQNDLNIAKADLDAATAALSTAQAAYDKIGGLSNPMIGMTPQSLTLQQASDAYQKALAVYNARVSPSDSQLKQAQVAVEQAHNQLARLTNPNPGDITVAQGAVAQAQGALDLAKQNLANAQIVAPFSGTVLWVGPHAGESVAPTAPVVTLADLSQPQVLASVDENALAQIQLGQAATITADALPGKKLSGRVSKIGALATISGGIIRVPVTIDVEPNGAPVDPGLSAVVEINVAQ